MIRNLVKKNLSRRALRRSAVIVVIKVLISAFTVQACAQAGPASTPHGGRRGTACYMFGTSVTHVAEVPVDANGSLELERILRSRLSIQLA